MTIQECYSLCGGDYNDVLTRMMKPERVAKFTIMFLRDDSFNTLKNTFDKTLPKRDYETAFRAAHTLKGVAANLSMVRLFKSAQTLTEALRPGNPRPTDEILDQMFKAVEADYKLVTDTITQFKNEQ